MSWLSVIKNRVVAFAKGPDTLVEKAIRVVSIVSQASTAVLALPVSLPSAIVTALTAVHTAADKVSNVTSSAKVVRICSIVGQGLATVALWPISLPAGIITALTTIHTIVDNLGDWFDDGKINQSFNTSK